MSEKQKLKKETAAITSFAYRNIKKDFTPDRETETITKQFHLERGEHNEAVIVEDRKTDWLELANKDADKCGLAYVLDLARRTGQGLEQFGFKDSEAMDSSFIDPMDPSKSLEKAASSLGSNTEKLEKIAKQLGVSTDELIDSFIKGQLAELISAKVDESAKATESEAQ